MPRLRSVLIPCALAVCLAPLAAAEPQKDAAGCKDHPLFTRMADMYVVSCKTADFDRATFKTGKATQENVEGRKFEIRYALPAGPPPPSPLAIIRNHQQAIAAIGGTTVWEDNRYTTLKIAKDGKEFWAQVDTAWGRGYTLTIVEKQAMVQDVVANAELFKAGLSSTGHVEVPGIFFDTAKAELKPESDAAVAEVAKLLKADPSLKVYVVGQTDNVSTLDVNLSAQPPRGAGEAVDAEALILPIPRSAPAT